MNKKFDTLKEIEERFKSLSSLDIKIQEEIYHDVIAKGDYDLAYLFALYNKNFDNKPLQEIVLSARSRYHGGVSGSIVDLWCNYINNIKNADVELFETSVLNLNSISLIMEYLKNVKVSDVRIFEDRMIEIVEKTNNYDNVASLIDYCRFFDYADRYRVEQFLINSIPKNSKLYTKMLSVFCKYIEESNKDKILTIILNENDMEALYYHILLNNDYNTKMVEDYLFAAYENGIISLQIIIAFFNNKDVPTIHDVNRLKDIIFRKNDSVALKDLMQILKSKKIYYDNTEFVKKIISLDEDYLLNSLCGLINNEYIYNNEELESYLIYKNSFSVLLYLVKHNLCIDKDWVEQAILNSGELKYIIELAGLYNSNKELIEDYVSESNNPELIYHYMNCIVGADLELLTKSLVVTRNPVFIRLAAGIQKEGINKEYLISIANELEPKEKNKETIAESIHRLIRELP